MKRLLVFLLVSAALSFSAHAAPFLKLTQPYENQKIPFVQRSFVFGAVQPATATLTINGVPVKSHTNGGFLTMIPFQSGPFKIEAVASDGVSTTTVSRMVEVDAPPVTYAPDHDKIYPLFPRTRVVLRSDDVLRVSFQGPVGGTASFKIGGRLDQWPMSDQSGHGIYEGIYRVQPTDHFDKADLTFTLQRRDGKKISSKAGAEIFVPRQVIPRFIETTDRAIVYTGPAADLGYDLMLLDGVRMEVTGEWGDFYKVAIGRRDEGWVKKSVSRELPAGTPIPRSVAHNIRVDSTETSTIIEIPLQYRHPHRVDQFINPHHLALTLYGVIADTDRIRYKSTNTIIKEMNWNQYDSDTYVLDIHTTQKLAWGYDVRYEGTKLILELRHQPSGFGSRAGALKGLKIALDAGHSKQNFGTIGPWGNTEASVTLMVANVVKKDLEKRGATVVMIQDGTKDPSLQERVDQAWAERAQMYLSIHCDATNEGTDPREVEGFSVHYYHPQSRNFAERLHDVYGKKSGIRDGGLWRSNLAVCRQTQMPSILFELGFLILPEFEEKVLTPAFQQLIADSIATSIQDTLTKPQQ